MISHAISRSPCGRCGLSPGCVQATNDRSSASLVYAGKLNVFTGAGVEGRSGLVMRPDPASFCMLCSYAGDGGSQNKQCLDGGFDPGLCVPGCTQDARNGFCNPYGGEASDGGYCGGKPFRPQDLAHMLQAQRESRSAAYNELIFDPDCWRANEAHAVEAFWYLTDPSVARETHADFLRAYPGAANTPVVRLDMSRKEAPFVLDQGLG